MDKMTAEWAIEKLKNHLIIGRRDDVLRNVGEIAIYAINKLIAKKPTDVIYERPVNIPIRKPDEKATIEIEALHIFTCPNCFKPIGSQFLRDDEPIVRQFLRNFLRNYKPKHCSECGQKLDWSETI